jgi:hypothetical protein
MKPISGWHFDNPAHEATLKPLCLEVEKHFTLPARRLYRYFAGSDDYQLRQDPPIGVGAYYRGFHVPRSGRQGLPMYLQECFFCPLEQFADVVVSSSTEMAAFDNLIYIRESTCRDVTGCATSYAHELQHFVQYGHTPKLWRVNGALYDNLASFDRTALATDIPSEREAEIISKRVAERVFGADAVRAFAEKQVQLMEDAGAQSQKGKWVFFRDVPSSTNYDLLADTKRLVEKYKGLIDFGIDVNKPEWWLEKLTASASP